MTERIVGLAFAILTAIGLYYLWLEIAVWIRRTWFADLSFVFTVIYVFLALWILEKAWELGPKRLFGETDH